jgi:hypothetical protein
MAEDKLYKASEIGKEGYRLYELGGSFVGYVSECVPPPPPESLEKLEEEMMALDFYGWKPKGMRENPSDVPSEDVFVLRSDVLKLLKSRKV